MNDLIKCNHPSFACTGHFAGGKMAPIGTAFVEDTKEAATDIYLQQMCKDLEAAEQQLRTNLEYRGQSFSQPRLDETQQNVNRLHELIRSYKELS